MTPIARILIAGFGSVDRGDDGVGALVAARVAERMPATNNVGPISDPLDLLTEFNGADLVIVVDALRSGTPPGTIRTLEMDVSDTSGANGRAEPVRGGSSTHGIGLAGVLRIARALGQTPRRLVVIGIEGASFNLGNGLSEAVSAAIPEAVARALEIIEEVCACA